MDLSQSDQNKKHQADITNKAKKIALTCRQWGWDGKDKKYSNMRHRLMVHFQTFFNDLIGLLCNCNPPALRIFLLAARKKYANTGMVFARRLIVITV